jgi:hypothetical protein
MATFEALRPGDEVCIKVPDSPIMKVLAVEGLKARCADTENLQRSGPSLFHQAAGYDAEVSRRRFDLFHFGFAKFESCPILRSDQLRPLGGCWPQCAGPATARTPFNLTRALRFQDVISFLLRV